jgi:hypothetical protein
LHPFRLDEFVREAPAALKAHEAQLLAALGGEGPLETRMQLRELQASYVYTTIMLKKAKVGVGFGWLSIVNSRGADLPAIP